MARTRFFHPLVWLLTISLLAAACSSSDSSASDSSASDSSATDATGSGTTSDGTAVEGSDSDAGDGAETPDASTPIVVDFGPAPEVLSGATDSALLADLDLLMAALDGDFHPSTIEAVAAHGDARVAWFFADLLRFLRPGPQASALVDGFASLTGAQIAEDNAWGGTTDHLLAWNFPAFDEYVTYKAALFTRIEPGWTPFFEDAGVGKDSAIDWRILSWGGVLIDDRPLGDPDPCDEGCIPALDDPKTTDAAGGDWYDDEAIVFGVVIDGEARAYPKNIMEIHEMVNDTVGGRRLGVPYCTLCGSAQAYLTDSVDEGLDVPVLRTSGLLSRSNKVMYDLNTKSVFDTFTGQAITGPLFDEGVFLEQVTVVTSTWGDWKVAHPDTTIVDQFGGIGRTYPIDPLRGRDDDGPIFPVGDVDPRYVAHTPVIGVVSDEGVAVGFVVEKASQAFAAGEVVQAGGVRLVQDGGGFRATDLDGNELVAHQAFWFAWTQFHQDGTIWEGN